MKNSTNKQLNELSSISAEDDNSKLNQFSSVRQRMPKSGWMLLQDLRHNAIAAWSSIHAYGDAVCISLMGRTVHFLFHPSLVRAVLMQDEQGVVKDKRQVATFKIAQGLNILTAHGVDWKRQRRILAPAFAPRRVTGYMALMAQAASEVNFSILPQQTGSSTMLDVERYATRLTMDVILRVLFSQRMPSGQVQSISESVRNLAQQGMRMLFWPFIPPAWFPYPGRSIVARSRALLGELIVHHIHARQSASYTASQHASPDLLDVMLQAKDEEASDALSGGLLSAQEIEDNCMAIFLAGHDTSATALAWWMGFMATHPEATERARQEVFDALGLKHASDVTEIRPEHLSRMPWLEATLKEAMRLRPPIAAPFMRQAQEDIQIQGIHICAGELVSLPIWQMHHDARWFPEPEIFRPERFLPGALEIPRGAWMPFGAGPHVCIGQHFAMTEMMLLAALLLIQVRWDFEPGDSLPEPRMDIVLKPERPIMLRIWKI